MAREIREYQATIPAGTPVNAPVTIDVSFPPRAVDEIHIDVPPGPNGVMGFRLTTDGQQVIPINPGAWFIVDDSHKVWPLSGFHDSGNWKVTGYNTGLYDHVVNVTFLLSIVGDTVSAMPAAPIAPADLNPPTLITDLSTAAVADFTGA